MWRDLVARLEEGDDAFMDNPNMNNPDTNRPADPKSVSDFDPLGVWRSDSLATPAANDAGPSEAGPRDFAADDFADEFVPEEPPILSNTEPALMLSWIAAAGGPLFLLFSAIFWRQAPMLLIVGVIAAFLAGAGYLLFRLPNHRDDDGGDGAVV